MSVPYIVGKVDKVLYHNEVARANYGKQAELCRL